MRDGVMLPIFGRGFSSKSKVVTAQKLTNLYREPQEGVSSDPDKVAMALYGTPGTMLVGNLGADPSRGALSAGNFIYSVHGNTVYQINNGWVYTAIGTIGTTLGRVDLETNGVQLMIVDGVGGYIYNYSTAIFDKISDINFPNGARTICFLAGYFIVDDPFSTGRFRWSHPYDGNLWNPLDFATAEFNPDALNAVISSQGYLYLAGSQTIEIWAASGDTAVFRRVGGAGMDWGFPSPWGWDNYKDSTLIMLVQSKLGEVQVLRIQGFNTQVLTGPEEANLINSQPVNGATGYSYSIDNHAFFQINFPNLSMLYDDLSSSWSVAQTGALSGRHIGEVRVQLFGVPYVSDYANGNWYRQDKNVYTDNGQVIVRELITRHVFTNYDRFSIQELFVDFDTGRGLDGNVQGSDPQVMVSWSKDGGRTFGTEVFLPLGKIGQYMRRVWLRMLGVAWDFVFKLRISDPIKVVIVGGSMRVKGSQ